MELSIILTTTLNLIQRRQEFLPNKKRSRCIIFSDTQKRKTQPDILQFYMRINTYSRCTHVLRSIIIGGPKRTITTQ